MPEYRKLDWTKSHPIMALDWTLMAYRSCGTKERELPLKWVKHKIKPQNTKIRYENTANTKGRMDRQTRRRLKRIIIVVFQNSFSKFVFVVCNVWCTQYFGEIFIVWYEAVNLSFSGKILAITSSAVQTGATLLDVTCCVRLHTLLRVVGCCCAKFETGQTFQPTTPNFSFVPWSPKRSATINVGSVCTALPTLLEPRTLITHSLQRLMGCILPTMHCGSQHCWELLHPFAHHCPQARNNSQHCCANNVGSCCVRLHAASSFYKAL